jgi:exopolysaccharide biosynthesis WecB/TagA/CpsF family protein
LCIGASLDFIAGKQRRAPAILQRWGLEWAWRLALSPRRLALRYIRCAMIFSKLLLMPDGARSAR